HLYWPPWEKPHEGKDRQLRQDPPGRAGADRGRAERRGPACRGCHLSVKDLGEKSTRMGGQAAGAKPRLRVAPAAPGLRFAPAVPRRARNAKRAPLLSLREMLLTAPFAKSR